MQLLHDLRSNRPRLDRRIHDDLRRWHEFLQQRQIVNLKRDVVEHKHECRLNTFNRRGNLVVSVNALSGVRRIQCPRIVMCIAVVARGQLMQLIDAAERRKSAAVHPRKTGRRDCVTDNWYPCFG